MRIMDRYFKEANDNPAALAERIGRAPSTITRILRGEREPSFDLARDIQKGTGKKVRAIAFLAACYQAYEKREKEAKA